MDEKTLMRGTKEERLLGGVCHGIAHYLNIDPVYVMFAFVALTLFGFFFVPLIYLILWLVLPGEDEEPLPLSERVKVNWEEVKVRIQGLYQQAKAQISELGLLN